MRGAMDYFSQTRLVHELAEKLALTSPEILACMHGFARKGDGATLFANWQAVWPGSIVSGHPTPPSHTAPGTQLAYSHTEKIEIPTFIAPWV